MPSDSTADTLRAAIRAHRRGGDARVPELIGMTGLDGDARARIADRAAGYVREIRRADSPGMMERFLAEYGLSTEEGIALMCLAEALLRVPDTGTIDALIEDKIAPGDWARHLGHAASPLVNASTWALLITGKVLEEPEPGLPGTLRGAVKRLGEPVIRAAVAGAMRELGRQFVLGRDIAEAQARGAPMAARGYAFSYDMLGEAARTAEDAARYHAAYAAAIESLAGAAHGADIRANPGISVKLSALHPRYEAAQSGRVMAELAPRLLVLAHAAKAAGMGFNIDAEEADRLDLSLDVIDAVLSDPGLAGWDGFGIVVQAYGPAAPEVLDWIHARATALDRRVMVRLVKGAYWDTEIKHAQVLGLPGYPVFTRKSGTDVCYLACARKLLGMTDRIYPQFATHNAHSVAAVLEMADDKTAFEFQRLHGMGAALHGHVLEAEGTRCRIYAPVGAHRDLLAYLVRRLLENGANSSFVNQIVDVQVPAQEVAACPIAMAEAESARPTIPLPAELYGPERKNSFGWDIQDPADRAALEALRRPFGEEPFAAEPILAVDWQREPPRPVPNPARPGETVGKVTDATPADAAAATGAAAPWDVPVEDRAEALRRAADLYEAEAGRLIALAQREAGKTLLDAIGELREAVDFLRYYAAEAQALDPEPCGRFLCISPWNFPLAIFTGQISAALAAGNAVLAKPSEHTPLIAAAAVRLLHEAGVPRTALQLLPGSGALGAALCGNPALDGIAFTGSTATAQAIHRALAETGNPRARLIAETGGLNAMVVDSTALPEQAVRDILASAFQSAGQRCSALRVLYVQQDVAERLERMLFGAMDELALGDPWAVSTDVGPVISEPAAAKIRAHIERAAAEGRVLKSRAVPEAGHFVAPTAIRVAGIADLEEEIFGPVLHIARYAPGRLEAVIEEVNAAGYGLTFGLHTRIDGRVQDVVDRVRAGNIYVNRNQIGAIVGSQPFGGEGLSGTGPKAGGPHYLAAFAAERHPGRDADPADAPTADPAAVQAAIDAARPRLRTDVLEARDMPGPTGETNRLRSYSRGVFLCLGPGAAAAQLQKDRVQAAGAEAVAVAPGAENGVDGRLAPEDLGGLTGFAGVIYAGPSEEARGYRRALAARPGPILPLLENAAMEFALVTERHLCVDTTASGGNAQLLAG